MIETTTTEQANLPDNAISELATPQPQQNQTPTERQTKVVASTITTDDKVNDEDLQDPEDTNQAFTQQNESLQELAKEIASLEARIATEQQNRAKGPRVKRLNSVSTKSVDEAAYLNSWRQKVERVGNQNYPDTKLIGEVIMLVTIRQNGSLSQVRILTSSGHTLLDEAALRIVRQAAPYASFTVEMRKAYDILEVVRTWQFTRSGAQFGS
jgi:protein TonB